MRTSPYHLRSSWFLFAGSCLLVTFLPSVDGATKFWTGAVNGNFSTGPNWVGSAAPVAGDDLVFQPNNLVTRFFVTNDFSPNRGFGSMTFQGSNYFARG